MGTSVVEKKNVHALWFHIYMYVECDGLYPTTKCVLVLMLFLEYNMILLSHHYDYVVCFLPQMGYGVPQAPEYSIAG